MTPTAVLYHRAKTCPRNVAFIKDKEIWTYERLATQVDCLARRLIERGVGKGDRVALHMANLPELVVAYHACYRVGAIAAPLSIRFKTAELRPLLQRLRPALYISQAALYSQVASIDPSILASDRRFIVDGSVKGTSVQPWTRLFAEDNGDEDAATRQVFLVAVAHGSVISWHINLLGEYDFSDEKLQDNVGIRPPELTP